MQASQSTYIDSTPDPSLCLFPLCLLELDTKKHKQMFIDVPQMMQTVTSMNQIKEINLMQFILAGSRDIELLFVKTMSMATLVVPRTCIRPFSEQAPSTYS